MPRFGTFGWSELISLLSVIIALTTVCVSLFGRSKSQTRSEQKTLDKLDNLTILSQETRDTVRDLNNKLDAHAERLASVESDIRTLFKRLERIENTCDAHLIHRPEGTD